jgi:hypothetical protein
MLGIARVMRRVGCACRFVSVRVEVLVGSTVPGRCSTWFVVAEYSVWWKVIRGVELRVEVSLWGSAMRVEVLIGEARVLLAR